jgi:hypothetical protein
MTLNSLFAWHANFGWDTEAVHLQELVSKRLNPVVGVTWKFRGPVKQRRKNGAISANRDKTPTWSKTFQSIRAVPGASSSCLDWASFLREFREDGAVC